MKIDTKFNFGDKFYYIGKYIIANKPGYIKIVVGSTAVNNIILQHDANNPFFYEFFIEDQLVSVVEPTILEGKYQLISLPTNEQFNFCFSLTKADVISIVETLLKEVEHAA